MSLCSLRLFIVTVNFEYLALGLNSFSFEFSHGLLSIVAPIIFPSFTSFVSSSLDCLNLIIYSLVPIPLISPCDFIDSFFVVVVSYSCICF